MKNWTIEITMRDENGNEKMTQTIKTPRLDKDICLALSSKDEEGKQKQVRPKCCEWNVKELFESYQRDANGEEDKTKPSKLNGEVSGFFVDAKIRFVNYEVMKSSLEAPKKAKEIKEASIEM